LLGTANVMKMKYLAKKWRGCVRLDPAVTA
jgi:hypothetical protein